MTNSTKQPFKAPWSAEEWIHGKGAFVIRNNKGYLVAENMSEQDAKRIARLPELYDALVEACGEYCPNLKYDIEKCGNCGGEGCKAVAWCELLQLVRNGK